MNHGFKLHPDSTLEITMPKGKKIRSYAEVKAEREAAEKENQ